MLRIKYFDAFKGENPFLVILGNPDVFLAAHDFFMNKREAYLNDPLITGYSEIAPLSRFRFYLTAEECKQIAEHFKHLGESDEPGHIYFDTAALEDIEVLISQGEYDHLF